MKKKSIILFLIGFFWLLYVTVATGIYVFEFSEIIDSEIQSKRTQVQVHSEITSVLLRERNTALLDYILRNAVDKNLFDFFIVRRKTVTGEVVQSYYARGAKLTNVLHPYPIQAPIFEGESFLVKTIYHGEFIVNLGGIKSSKALILQNLAEGNSYLIRNIVIVTSLAALLFFFVLRDILNISKFISRGNKGKVIDLHPRSIEAERILNASLSSQRNSNSLREQIEDLKIAAIPAIHEEMKKDLPIPRTIRCCVARIDMNGYTNLFMTAQPEELVEYLNSYFYLANEVIGRFGGKIYQYLGDEIIFMFQGDRDEELVRLTFACLQSLTNQLMLTKVQGHPLYNKCSFSLGDLEFLKLDEGYFFLGEPLIESVRLLSLVEEKDRNTICFQGALLTDLQDLCRVSYTKTLRLKGYDSDTTICFANDLVEPVAPPLKSTTMVYYRSDLDILRILEEMTSCQKEGSKDLFIQYYQYLKSFPVMACSQMLKEKGTKIIREQLNAPISRETEVYHSCWVAMLSHLYTQVGLDAHTLTQLKRLTGSLMARIAANSLQSLSHFEKNHRFYKPFLHHHNPRVQSEAIFILGKKKLNKTILSVLEQILKSKTSVQQKSGIIAAEKLLRHYKAVDPVYFASNDDVMTLKRILKREELARIRKQNKRHAA